jgi:hypothetical protein
MDMDKDYHILDESDKNEETLMLLGWQNVGL